MKYANFSNPKGSKFRGIIQDKLREQKKHLCSGATIKINLPPRGYTGKAHVNIVENNSATFLMDWKGSNPNRIPAVIKAQHQLYLKAASLVDITPPLKR